LVLESILARESPVRQDACSLERRECDGACMMGRNQQHWLE
jgi:hypothetical protein